MSIPNRYFKVVDESRKFDSGRHIQHLLAGLERQKEELGPIAVELIELLHRLGVGVQPQAKRKP